MSTSAHDLGYALRQVRKAPLFASAVVATLAIGIGATTAIFSTVNATLLRPLPFPRSGELLDVHTHLSGGRVTTGLLSMVEIGALNDARDLVVRAAGFSDRPLDGTLVREDGTPAGIVATAVTEGFFDVLGLPMVHGRAFTHEEHVRSGPNAPLVVVASYRAWTTLLHADPDIVGKTIRIVEAPVGITVVGVAAPGLDLPRGTDFWFNARNDPQDVGHNFDTILRLRPGAALEALRAKASAAMAAIARTVPSDVGREYVIRPLVSSLVGDLGPTLVIVLGATALLLVLACVNVTNLLLARGTTRARDVAVRLALGASRGRVVRQLLTESMMLATVGALAGWLLAGLAVRALLVLGASKLPRLETVPFDWRVLLFSAAVLVFCGFTMGVAPAWRLAGTDVRALLNESGRSTTSSRGTSRLMSGMIVLEVALAIALTAGAGWLVQSFARLRATDPGFTATGRLVVNVRPTRNLPTRADALAWSDQMLDRVRSAAGDALVGAAATYPLDVERDTTTNVELQGQPHDPSRVASAHVRVVTPGFFGAMGIDLVAGRTFTIGDRNDTGRVAVVNRAFVLRFLPDVDPLTSAVAYGFPTVDPKTMARVVGVVDDVRYKSLAEEAEPTFYLAQGQGILVLRLAVVVAPRGREPDALVSPIRAELKRFDPQMVAAFTTGSATVADALSRQQLGMTLMLVFGATALALAAIGIYGVIAYAVAQRGGELATRMAVGASRGEVFWLVMRSGQRLGLAGLVLGLAAAYAGGRAVATSVFGMRAGDPLVLGTACVVVAAVTFLATTIPALRASRLDPLRALRSE